MSTDWLCCPLCRGQLLPGADERRCAGCGRVFPVLFGIPDLRIPVAAWIDFDEDRSFASALAADPAARTFESMVTRVWESRRSIPASVVHRRLREIANMHGKSATDLSPSGDAAALKTYDERRLSRVGRGSPDQRPSMGQDMAKGRRTEIEFLNGFVVREGEQVGIQARANERLVDIVKKVERGELKQDPRHITELRLN